MYAVYVSKGQQNKIFFVAATSCSLSLLLFVVFNHHCSLHRTSWFAICCHPDCLLRLQLFCLIALFVLKSPIYIHNCFSPFHHSALVWFLVFEEQKDRADNAKCGTQLRDTLSPQNKKKEPEKEAWAWQWKGITGCDCKRQRTILIYTKNSNNCESQTKGLQTQQWNKKSSFMFLPFFLFLFF